MPFEDRKKLIAQIESIRGGRKLISLCNLDRPSEPELPGLLGTQIRSDFKACLYRVLKETCSAKDGVDLFLYTRGGDIDTIWPIINLIREFDENFEVLIPFRAHSSGTLLALGGRKIVMTKLGELSPIDPTTGNAFAPRDQISPSTRLGISVEEVYAYEDFIMGALGLGPRNEDGKVSLSYWNRRLVEPFLRRLTSVIHPLALGNVQRVHNLIKKLAVQIVELHKRNGQDAKAVSRKLTSGFHSHTHIIGRKEAREILGVEQVEFASPELDAALDMLLVQYQADFEFMTPFILSGFMQNAPVKDFRFVGGVLESKSWPYLYTTKGKLTQFSKLPPGVQVQVQPGQPVPLIPGLAREFGFDIIWRGWEENHRPQGVTK